MPGSSSTDHATERAALSRALFAPARIALVGATPHQDRLTSRPQRVLKKHGFRGTIIPVSPRYAEMGGDRTSPSVRSIAEPIDHAFVMVPAAAVPQVIAECCAAGVRVATIFTAGFAEASEEGERRQHAMVTMARTAGLRLLGPNCLGVVDVSARVILSANAVLEHEVLRAGHLSVVSQSGSMLGAIITRAQERGLGFSKLVSVGNECDIAVGELVHLLVDDPQTRAILLFLETFRDAPALASAARRAYAAGKPIIAFKLGRSAIGREIAATHTGAIVGGDDLAQAFFRDHGIIRVEVFEALFETAQLVLGHRPPRARRVGAVTVSGGGAAMVVDRLGLSGIEVVPPTPAMIERLMAKKIRVDNAAVVDLPMGRADRGAYAQILTELMTSAHCDAVVAVQGSAATYMPEVVQERILAAPRESKPLAVFVGPRAERALSMLQEGGVAAFRTPEACADAVRAYCDWREPRPPVAVADEVTKRVCEAVRAAGQGSLDAHDAARLLSAIGIPCTPSQVIRSGRDAVGLPFPVVVKILSRDIRHKTEVDGVALDVVGAIDLAHTADKMIEQVRRHAPRARIDGLLVQTMERGIGEVIVGFRRDREVGPLIMVGVGGTSAELWTGQASRTAPVSAMTALEMIAEVPGLALLRGFRNRPAGDLEALAQVIHSLSLLALSASPAVLEAEINPLIVRARGAVAVDVRVEIDASDDA